MRDALGTMANTFPDEWNKVTTALKKSGYDLDRIKIALKESKDAKEQFSDRTGEADCRD